METITLNQSQFEELKFYKKLVENNLQEDLSISEINQIKQAKKTPILNESDFLAKNSDLKNV